MILGGVKKCAKSHVLRAESHTQHGVNVKKRLPWGKPLMKIIYLSLFLSC